MIRERLIITILLMSLCWNHITAQNKHNILLWGSGGYSSLMTKALNNYSTGYTGFGVGVGAGYMFHYKWFILNTGAEFTYLNPQIRLKTFTQDKPLYDSEGDYYIGHFQFSGNHDRYRLGNINIPLMVGVQFKKIYFLVGVKYGLNLFGNSKVETLVTSTGTYPQFIGTFGNMPNHNFGQIKEITRTPVKLVQNYSFSWEVGSSLGSANTGKFWKKDKTIHYWLSIFCDYGLSNVIGNSATKDLIQNNTNNGVYQPRLNSFILSAPVKGSFVNAMYVGLKYTVIFGLGNRNKFPCYNGSDDMFTKKKIMKNRP